MQSDGQGDTSRKRKWDVSTTQGTRAAAVNAPLAARAHQGVLAAVQRINKGIASQAAVSPSVNPNCTSVSKDELNPFEDVIINDAEPSVRIQLTKRSTQDNILRDFGCVAITRGKYRPRGTLNPDNDEKPLYLAIQASSSITHPVRKKRAVADAAEFVRNKILGANKPYAGDYSAVPAPGQIAQSDIGALSVYVGFAADTAFDTAGRLRGPNDKYFRHIMSKTGATAHLRGSGSGTAESSEPLHVMISCDNPTGLKDAKRLVEDLIQTVKSEYLLSLSPSTNQTKQLAAGSTASSMLQHPMYQGGPQGLLPPPDLAGVSSSYGAQSPHAGQPLQNKRETTMLSYLTSAAVASAAFPGTDPSVAFQQDSCNASVAGQQSLRAARPTELSVQSSSIYPRLCSHACAQPSSALLSHSSVSDAHNRSSPDCPEHIPPSSFREHEADFVPRTLDQPANPPDISYEQAFTPSPNTTYGGGPGFGYGTHGALQSGAQSVAGGVHPPLVDAGSALFSPTETGEIGIPTGSISELSERCTNYVEAQLLELLTFLQAQSGYQFSTSHNRCLGLRKRFLKVVGLQLLSRSDCIRIPVCSTGTS